MATLISNSVFRHLAVLTFLVLSSCTYGPKQKDMTFLESLSGKHYESGPTTPGSAANPNLSPYAVPFAERRRANVVIEGRIMLQENNLPRPLPNISLSLLQESQVLGQVRTDTAGSFRFVGDFPDGPALIRLDSTRYPGEYRIRIKGFEVNQIQINVPGDF